MTGFEPQTSSIESNRSANWATTAAHERLYLFESKAKSLATAGGDYWSADTFVLTTNCALDPLLVDIYLKAHSHSLPLTLWRAADSCIAHREIKNSTVESGDHLVESEWDLNGVNILYAIHLTLPT